MKKSGKIMAIALVVACLLIVFAACGEEPGGTTGGGSSSDKKFTVAFVSDGVNYYSTEVAPGVAVNEPSAPSKKGYTFSGWFTSADDTGTKISFPLVVNANVTYYAHWQAQSFVTTNVDDYVVGKYGEAVGGYYQETLSGEVEAYDFIEFIEVAENEGNMVGIYLSSDFAQNNLKYVSSNSTWLEHFGAGSTSGLQSSPRFALNKGNNTFYLRMLDKNNLNEKTYQINIRRGTYYTVTFVNSTNNHYPVYVPFAGTEYNINDDLNSQYAGKVDYITDDTGSTKSVWDGVLYEEDIPAECEARAGYTLNYWYYYNGNNKYIFNTGTVITADITLQAEWTAKEYNVVLSKEGCDRLDADSTYRVIYGSGAIYDAVGNPKSFAIPEKSNERIATFAGWYYIEGGREIKLTDADGELNGSWAIDSASPTVTLVARWDYYKYDLAVTNVNPDAGRVTVEISGNESDLADSSDGVYKLIYDESYKLTAAANEGYRFLGFTTTEHGSDYKQTVTGRMLAVTTTYYAQWEPITYTFNYNLYEGAADGLSVLIVDGIETGDVAQQNRITISDTGRLYTVFRKGFAFKGWKAVSGDKELEVPAEYLPLTVESWKNLYAGAFGSGSVPTAVTMYPILETDKYTVSIDSNMSDPAGKIYITVGAHLYTLEEFKQLCADTLEQTGLEYTVEYDTEITVKVEGFDPETTTFTKWTVAMTAEHGNENLTDLNTEFTFNLVGNAAINAVFEATPYKVVIAEKPNLIGDYTVTFPVDDYSVEVAYGTGAGEYSFAKGTLFDADGVMMTEEYFNFIGYYYVPESGEAVQVTDNEGKAIEQFIFKGENDTVTLVAYYKACPHTVSVTSGNAAGGEVGMTGDGETVYGAEVTLTATRNPGYLFDGWFRRYVQNNELKEELLSTELEFVYTVANYNADIVAKFTAKTYNLNFVYENGTETVNLTATFNKLEMADSASGAVTSVAPDGKQYYEFLGWSLSTSGEPVIITDNKGNFTGEWVYDLAGDTVTLRAAWRSIFVMTDYALSGITDYGKLNYTEIVIPESVNGVTVTAIGDDAFKGYAGLMSVTIPVTVTSVGARAFADCGSLETVTFANNINLSSIGELAFMATGITDMVLPASVTSYGNGMLTGCNNLVSLTYTGTVALGTLFGTNASYGGYPAVQNNVTYYLPESLTSLTVTAGISTIADYSLANAKNITSVTLPATVKNIGRYAFRNTGITSFDFTNVKSIGGGAFRNTGLVSADLSGITSIGSGAFAYAKALTSVTWASAISVIPSSCFEQSGAFALTGTSAVIRVEKSAFANSGVTSLDRAANIAYIGEYAFVNTSYDKAAVTEFPAATFVGRGAFNNAVNNVGQVFYRYNGTDVSALAAAAYIADGAFAGSGIASVSVPAGILRIGSDAFAGCTSLASVTFEAGLQDIGPRAFEGCTSLGAVALPDSLISIGTRAFADTTGASFAVTFGAGVTTIDTEAFAGSNVSSVELPASLAFMGTGVFSGSKLATVTFAEGYAYSLIPAATFEGTLVSAIELPLEITTVGSGAFRNSALAALTFEPGADENDKPTLATVESYAFAGTKLIDVNMPEALKTVGAGAFSGINTLKSFTATAVTTVSDEMLADNPALNSVTLGRVTSIGNRAFAGDTAFAVFKTDTLTNVLPSSVTSIGTEAFENNFSMQLVIGADNSLATIGDRAFLNATRMVSVTISAATTYLGSQAFSGCSSLSSLTFADGAKLTAIGDEAFAYCSSLTSVKLPASVKNIGMGAFRNAVNLTKVYIGAGVTSIDDYAFGGINSAAVIGVDAVTAPAVGESVFDSAATVYVDYRIYDAATAAGWPGNVTLSYDVNESVFG